MVEPGQGIIDWDAQSQDLARSAEAAKAPRQTARADNAAAATATTATAAATAATTAAATATAATATSPCHLLETGVAAIFLVEQMERGEADVSDLFFAEQDRLGRREVQFLRRVCIRQSRC